MRSLSRSERAVVREALSSLPDLLLAYDLGEAHRSGRSRDYALDLGLYFLPTLSIEDCEDGRFAVIESLAVALASPEVRAIVLNQSSANISYAAINRGTLLYSRSETERTVFENGVRTDFQRMVYRSSTAAWRARTE